MSEDFLKKRRMRVLEKNHRSFIDIYFYRKIRLIERKGDALWQEWEH